jgi:hypothetical protein
VQRSLAGHGLGLDFDPPAGIEQRRNDNHARRRTDLLEDFTVYPPDGQIDAVPDTAMRFPTRTARLIPIDVSYSEPEDAVVRGGVIAHTYDGRTGDRGGMYVHPPSSTDHTVPDVQQEVNSAESLRNRLTHFQSLCRH